MAGAGPRPARPRRRAGPVLGGPRPDDGPLGRRRQPRGCRGRGRRGARAGTVLGQDGGMRTREGTA
ncbi:hypothetical protein [Ornithinimicrobium kibberense]|uniref:hypothetical protein n=1 Tax=Ornithinimicrobium kibberense TaxID=282060 RepID=UPI003613422D